MGCFDARSIRGGIRTPTRSVGVGYDRSTVVKSEMSDDPFELRAATEDHELEPAAAHASGSSRRWRVRSGRPGTRSQRRAGSVRAIAFAMGSAWRIMAVRSVGAQLLRRAVR